MIRATRLVGGFFLDIIETVVIALSIFLVVYLFIMQPHQVNGNSMFPNFEDGDYLLTDKVSYALGNPERGDVVVFHAPPSANCPQGTGCDFIKRVIGIPGDTVEIRRGAVYLNGELFEDSFIPEDYITRAGNYMMGGSVIVPEGWYFVMGDNRSHSSDSRVWGPVPKNLIVGRGLLRYWPFKKFGLIKNPLN